MDVTTISNLFLARVGEISLHWHSITDWRITTTINGQKLGELWFSKLIPRDYHARLCNFGGESIKRLKLKFHGTDNDTDILADFCATILARKSARKSVSVSVPWNSSLSKLPLIS